MSHLSTHVLDAVTGGPAVDLAVRLESADGIVLADRRSDGDGRVTDLGPDRLEPGGYRVLFATGEWFEARSTDAFYPRVTIDVTIAPGVGHYHVPLLLSPFAYSTYRGS